MATKTLGTTAQTSLTAVAFLPSYGSVTLADFAAISLGIKDDLNVAHPVIPGSFTQDGQLFVPNRGVLRVLPGDWVGYSSRGFPYLVSKDDIANGNWVHT